MLHVFVDDFLVWGLLPKLTFRRSVRTVIDWHICWHAKTTLRYVMYISKNIDYFALCFNFISFFFKHLNSFVWNKWWGSRDAWIKHINALPGLSFARLLKFELWKDICIKKLFIWLTCIFIAFRFIGLFPLSVLSLILLFLLLLFDDVKHFLVFLCIIIQLIVDGEYFTILLNVMHYLSLIHIWILRFVVYYSSFSLFHLLF